MMKMDAYEHFACAEYLSVFPNDLSYDEVMDLLLEKSDEVLVWEAFEDHPVENVHSYIESLRFGLAEVFIPRDGRILSSGEQQENK